jgi:hypothetical protein
MTVSMTLCRRSDLTCRKQLQRPAIANTAKKSVQRNPKDGNFGLNSIKQRHRRAELEFINRAEA